MADNKELWGAIDNVTDTQTAQQAHIIYRMKRQVEAERITASKKDAESSRFHSAT